MDKKTASKIEITKFAMKKLTGWGGWVEGGRWGEWFFYGTGQM